MGQLEMRFRPYTTVDALTEVLRDWKPGEEKLGYQIQQEVVAKLQAHGVWKRPMDSSVTRRLREHAAAYGIKNVRLGESVYVREKGS
jgi:histone acetyltransferase (RNA polymerase elongator complex component)